MKSRATRAKPTDASMAAMPTRPEAIALPSMPGAVVEPLRALMALKLEPSALSTLQTDYIAASTALWNELMSADSNATQGIGLPPIPLDKRFAAPDWASAPDSSYLSRMYLLNARTLSAMAESLQGDERTRAQVRFAVQQWVDAAAPSNIFAFNPEARRLAIASKGESIAQGMKQLWNDVQQGHLSQTDESQFEVGRNVATTEGAVVFENELFQLLEYKPLTDKIHAVPMLFVPPCINKFYILDLQPENSLIRYTVEQGHRVFVVSWRNPDASVAQKTWDDYIDGAAIRAITVVQEITGCDRINTLGFCVGGTILATALAVLAARGERPAASMTLLTTFLDFDNTGVLDLFVDEAMVRLRESTLGPESPGGGSLLKGQELATTFSFLRPNDLVWNYVVGNYLKGEKPPAFDLLYWNSDGTNLPGPMYTWYLRNTYLENNLATPNKVKVCGEKVDLSSIQVPAYVYGSRDDHIVPWDGAFRNIGVLKSKTRFVLGASGHIAGVINPPAKKKRSHWIGSAPSSGEASAWLAGATEHAGSWWPDWAAWLRPLSGKEIAAPKGPGNQTHRAIEPAPGRYVRQKA